MDRLSGETATALQHALVMAALADGRSRFAHARADDHTRALVNGLLGLGVAVIIDGETDHIDVAGTGGYWPNSDAELHMADSFPLTCLLVAACSVGRGQYTVTCDSPELGDTPFVPLLSALVDLRARVIHDVTDDGRVVVNIGPEPLRGGSTRLPVGCPSAVLESLLAVAPYAVSDVLIEARGTTGHATEHVMPLMDAFGVSVIEDAGRIIVAAPQRYRGQEITEWL
jgi:5-enolpyruvylshikimate-3-phosphate synthase